MLDHLLSSVHLLGRRPATGVGAGRRHLRPSVIVHGAVAGWRWFDHVSAQPSSPKTPGKKVRMWLGSFVPACIFWAGCRPPVPLGSAHLLLCGCVGEAGAHLRRHGAIGIRRSATPENTWQKVRVWIGNFFPACISWAGCWPPISSGSAGNGLRGDPPGRGRAGWRGTRASLVAGANGWVGARGACGGRALSLSEHGLSGRGAWGLGRTLNVDRAR